MILSSALWKPVDYQGLARRTDNKAAVFHTAVSGASSLFAYWAGIAKAGSTIGAHFYVTEDGDLEQYVDTYFQIGHAFAANSFAVGIETWDGAQSPPPPWNDAQVTTLVELAQELGCPDQLLKETPSDGVGYHRQYDSWNENSHTCPGDLRVAQLIGTIIPRLGKEENVAYLYNEDCRQGYAEGRNLITTELGDKVVKAQSILANKVNEVDKAERDNQIGRRFAARDWLEESSL